MNIQSFLSRTGLIGNIRLHSILRAITQLAIITVLACCNLARAEHTTQDDTKSGWPLLRNGVSREVGGTTYFDSPSLRLQSQRIGRIDYHRGYDRQSGQNVSGSSQQTGNTTYYQLNGRRTTPSYSGRSYPVGGTTYYEGRDSQSGKTLSGRSYQLGNKTYYDFRESGSGQKQSWSSQKIGNSTYYSER